MKGAVIAMVLSGLLAGCSSGEAEASRADAAFVALEHVENAQTAVRRPGLPTNRLFATFVTFSDGVTQDQQAQTLDDMLVIARDELGDTANVGYQVAVDGGTEVIDMDAVAERLGELGPGALALGGGTLRLSQEELQSYESPGGAS